MNKSKPQLQFRRVATLPIILQDERAECGQACVAMVSHYFGHDTDLYHIRKLCKPSSLGVNLLDIKNTLEQLGLRTRALRVSLDELSLVKTPAIMHWNMNHFVVLKQVKKNHVVIHDPAIGIRRVRFDEVSESFTGVILEIEKSNDFQVIRERNNLTLYDLIKTITGIRLFLIVLMLLSLSIEVLSLLNPLFMQYITDSVIATADISNLYVIGLAFMTLSGLQTFTEFIRGNMGVYLSNNLTEQFSSNVVNHLLKLPLTFFEKRHKGDIQSKFHSIDQIQKKIGADFINTVLDGCFILINLCVMLIYSPLLTLVVLCSLSLFAAIRYVSYHVPKKQAESSIYQHAKAASVFLETLHGIIPIKSFLKENTRLTTWRNSYIHALNADIALSKTQLIYNGLNQLLFHSEHILVICVGTSLVLSNKLSVGMLIAFLSYRMLLVNKASSFIQNIFDYQLISIQLNRLSDILFAEPEIISSGIGLPENVQGSLSLKNISFQYDGQKTPILKHINLEIKAGEKIAIIGPSGCGKSTLLKVMMGLLDKTEGTIYIDNRPLDEFGLKNYRELTASVMQDDVLLSGSILNNIAFFDQDIDLDRVYAVAHLACIHDTIKSLPMRYETLVGDMGSTLSGGQKQRILLARALYKQPKLLFLDEATSHLDKANENEINQSLKALDITQIIIAHRQETIQMADRVIDLSTM